MLTNEEKKVPFYFGTGNPTDSSGVVPSTPLDELNLNWSERELPQKLRTKHVHGLHPYLGKYIPQLVEIFLRKYFRPGQTVLDPFCGSGTTLIQANELGIGSVGYDISAFNVLLSRVKTRKYDLDKTRWEVMDILAKTKAATQGDDRQIRLWDEDQLVLEITESDNQYLKEWYAPRSLRELLTYLRLLQVEDYECQDLLKVILSRSARSARQTPHYELDFPKEPQKEPYWCYKHSRTCFPTPEAFKFLRRYSLDTLRRIEEFSAQRTDAGVAIHHGDSRKADIPRVDGVITSPPYVGLIDYHEQHAYAYHLLGLKDHRVDEIGPAAGGTSQRAREQYQADIAAVFRRIAEKMPTGGRMIVVAGDRRNLYGDIAEAAGMDVEGVVQRHVNRRTGRRSNEFYESVFVWRKP